MEKPNVVVIGYGFAGRCFHAYLVGLADGLNLYGIATSRSEARDQIQRDLGVKTFRHFDEVLADPAVDLVVLATPNDLHAPHAIQAMAAGKHVVTDKPMCLSMAEADQMIAASQKHDRLLSVFQNRRWDGDFLAVKDALAQGLLGDPFLLEMFWGQYGPPRGWRSIARHGGGKFFDLGAHLVDQALQLIDAPLDQGVRLLPLRRPAQHRRRVPCAGRAPLCQRRRSPRGDLVAGGQSQTALVCAGHRRRTGQRGR